MNATLVASVLLFGGWVLPESGDTTPPLREDLTQPSSVQQHEMRIKARQMPTAPSLNNEEPAPPTRRYYDQGGAMPPSRSGSASMRPMMMPTAPTDAGTAGRTIPTAPTSTADQTPRGDMPRGSGSPTGPDLGPAIRPGLQTSGRAPNEISGMSRSRGLFSPRTTSNQPPMYQPIPTGNFSGGDLSSQASSYAPASIQMPDKAFSAYRPASPMSPYLQMYTNKTANGTIDPYNNAVRPTIDQSQTNQRFGSQIGGLQRSVSRQGAALNRLNNQEVPVQGGLVNPQYFINYQQYYPGAAQSGATIGQ